MSRLPTQLSCEFAAPLRRAADAILQDTHFQRSPVQSRLLRYLVDTTLEPGPPPNQYRVAVDGLGKGPDFDLANDSYPRVQIARLRKNLEDYYTRNPPSDGVRIVIDPGQYALRLERVDAPPVDEAVQLLAPIPAPVSDPDRTARSWWVVSGMAAAALAATIVAVLVPSVVPLGARDPAPAAAPEFGPKPILLMVADRNGLTPDNPAATAIVNSAMRVAEVQLAHSLVSTLRTDTAPPDEADYRMKLNFGMAEARDVPELRVMLTDHDGDVIYSDRIAFDPDQPADFNAQITAAMIFATSPSGIIARRENNRIVGPPATDYECFLAIENQRAFGGQISTLLNSCLTNHPNSEFAAFWHARRALMRYIEDIRADLPVEKTGPAWDDLTHALNSSPFNPFANFLAAKIALVDGDCDAGRAYLKRAFDGSTSYPLLLSALTIEGAPCLDSASSAGPDKRLMRIIFENDPNPDPMLHLHLILAALAQRDLDRARNIARRIAIHQTQDQTRNAGLALRRALQDPEYVSANELQLRQILEPLVWNRASVDRIVNTLAEDPVRGGRTGLGGAGRAAAP